MGIQVKRSIFAVLIGLIALANFAWGSTKVGVILSGILLLYVPLAFEGIDDGRYKRRIMPILGAVTLVSGVWILVRPAMVPVAPPIDLMFGVFLLVIGATHLLIYVLVAVPYVDVEYEDSLIFP